MKTTKARMNAKGQIATEAIIAIAVLSGVFLIMTGITAQQSSLSEKAAETENAKTLAIECAMIASSIFSNTTTIESEAKECTGSGAIITGIFGEKQKKAVAVASGITTKVLGNKKIMEVETLAHYK